MIQSVTSRERPMSRTTVNQGTASLRQRQKARTRQELLEAALDTFSRVGFGLATVEAIAGRAGASKGTVYAHFPDGREGLFRELYEDLSNRTVERAQQLHQEADGLLSQIRGTEDRKSTRLNSSHGYISYA